MAERKTAAEKRKAKEINNLKYQAKMALPKALALALEDRKASVDAGTMLGDLIEVWGGPRQLAVDIYSEFQRAAKGGMTRQRILEMFQRLIMHTSDRDLANVARPADMTDEELDSIAMSYANRVINDNAGTKKTEPDPKPVARPRPEYEEEEEGWG
jgi:hypothetical protein